MQIRRWKYLSESRGPQSCASNGFPSRHTPSSELSGTKVTEKVPVQFINTSHPSDAVSTNAKKKIRSHVARGIHASRRGQTARRGQVASVLKGNHSILRDSACTLSHDSAVQLGLESSRGEAGQPDLELPDPATLLCAARKDPFQAFVRPFADREHFLLDHYITSVLPNTHSYCDHEDESFFLAGMKALLVPFALSDPALLSGILLSACRSLAPQDRQLIAPSDDYSHMALRYKHECIQATNKAITSEGMGVKDATIAVVLFMCADEFLYGSFETSLLHAGAIIKMIKMRGGMQNLGLGGFLRQLISWCILGPNFPNLDMTMLDI